LTDRESPIMPGTSSTKFRERPTASNAWIVWGWGKVAGVQKVTIGTTPGGENIAGTFPRFPTLRSPGIEVDGKTVFTSDQGVKLEWLPDWVASVGSGYIGLEFSDVYSALGCEVTMIEALDQLMPGFAGTLLTRRAGANTLATSKLMWDICKESYPRNACSD